MMVLVFAMAAVVIGRRQNRRQLPLVGPVSANPGSCLRKNYPDP